MVRIGPRALMTAGLIVAAAGFVLLTGVDARPSYLVLTPSFLSISCGIGSAVPAMTTTLLPAVGKTEAGVASAARNMIRHAAGAGGALFGATGGTSVRN